MSNNAYSPFLFFQDGGEQLAEIDAVISCWPDRGLTGRRKIYTNKKRITDENVVEVLGKAILIGERFVISMIITVAVKISV